MKTAVSPLITLLPWIPGLLCGISVPAEFTVLEGSGLTVPCHYDPEYVGHVKYWCSGRAREFCSSLARSDDPAPPAGAKAGVFDDPAQLVFTVTMGALKESDAGWYMCGVEIGGIWTADAVAYTNVRVIHGMSVANNHLSGEEGGNVTVQCFYSERYRGSEKKWCRSGDWASCVLIGSGGSHEDPTLSVRDDGAGTLAVTMRRLQMREAGWYLCMAGQQQVAVHVQVTPQPYTTAAAAASTSRPMASRAAGSPLAPRPIAQDSGKILTLESLVVCSTIVVLAGLAIFTWRMWKRHRQDAPRAQVAEMAPMLTERPREAIDLQNATVVFIKTKTPNIY